jgi:hypothetical protein
MMSPVDEEEMWDALSLIVGLCPTEDDGGGPWLKPGERRPPEFEYRSVSLYGGGGHMLSASVPTSGPVPS